MTDTSFDDMTDSLAGFVERARANGDQAMEQKATQALLTAYQMLRDGEIGTQADRGAFACAEALGWEPHKLTRLGLELPR
jgi:hypothetical protein